MICLAETSPSQHKWWRYSVLLIVWAIFLSAEESLVGANISSLFINHSHYIQYVVWAAGLFACLQFCKMWDEQVQDKNKLGLLGWLFMIFLTGRNLLPASPVSGLLIVTCMFILMWCVEVSLKSYALTHAAEHKQFSTIDFSPAVHKRINVICYCVGIIVWSSFLFTQERFVGIKIATWALKYEQGMPGISEFFFYCFSMLSCVRLYDALNHHFSFNLRHGKFSLLWIMIAAHQIDPIASTFNALLLATAVFMMAQYLDAFSMDQIAGYKNAAIETKRELKRIEWPSYGETLKFVGVVGTFAIVSSLFWWIMDGIITRILSFLLQLLR